MVDAVPAVFGAGFDPRTFLQRQIAFDCILLFFLKIQLVEQKSLGSNCGNEEDYSKTKKIKESELLEKSNAQTKHIEDNNQNEDNPHALEDNSMQVEENFECNNHQIEDNLHAFEDNGTQHEQNLEAMMENDGSIQDVDANVLGKRKSRSPTKIKRLPSNFANRIEVEFNAQATPIGEGLVRLSSYLGPLVREHVPVTLNNWRHLDDDLKAVLWKSIQLSEMLLVQVQSDDSRMWYFGRLVGELG